MAAAQPWLMRGRTKAFGIVIVAVLIWMFLRVSPPVPIASWGGVVAQAQGQGPRPGSSTH